MKRLKAYRKSVEVASLTFSLLILPQIQELINESQFINGKSFIYLTSLFLTILIYLFSEKIFLSLYHFQIIRKILMGSEYIEGVWAEIAFLPNTTSPISYSILEIKVVDDTFMIQGESYETESNIAIGAFSSFSSRLEFPKFSYHFYYDQHNQDHQSEGITRIQFQTRNNKIPLSLSGFFFNLEDEKKVNFRAWKINDKEVLQKMDKSPNTQFLVLDFLKSTAKHFFKNSKK